MIHNENQQKIKSIHVGKLNYQMAQIEFKTSLQTNLNSSNIMLIIDSRWSGPKSILVKRRSRYESRITPLFIWGIFRLNEKWSFFPKLIDMLDLVRLGIHANPHYKLPIIKKLERRCTLPPCCNCCLFFHFSTPCTLYSRLRNLISLVLLFFGTYSICMKK